MVRDQADDRRRALVMGKYKFLYQDDTEDIEAGDKFKLCIAQNQLLGPVQYRDKEGKDPDVLKIYGQERVIGEGYSDPDVKIPGVLDLFTVVWSNPFGDIFVDQDIKLFEFEDVQKYSTYNDGPKSRDFCRFYTNSSSRDMDGFDASIFWSTGFLWKHFRTCGVEAWDLQLQDLIHHYRNWKEWTKEVHNLPASKKFSENRYSGPASTSSRYSRARSPPPALARAAPSRPHTSHAPVLTAPPPGHTVLVPVPGPDGRPVQVQLSTLPTPAPTSYKYVHPRLLGQSGSSWSSQVTAFLSGPVSGLTGEKRAASSPSPPTTSTPVKVRRTELGSSPSPKSKFMPKAAILPPDSTREEFDDARKLFTGKILDWRGKFGFICCEEIRGKIFLHSKDILAGKRSVCLGAEAKFQVLHKDSSIVGAKAVHVTISV